MAEVRSSDLYLPLRFTTLDTRDCFLRLEPVKSHKCALTTRGNYIPEIADLSIALLLIQVQVRYLGPMDWSYIILEFIRVVFSSFSALTVDESISRKNGTKLYL
ncbi:unnamed protein product [Albugo candida]|uniref:Uncharacterized protein n=1 Tax=Albugo candida TaxID=65357 RepID=A0A024FX30_9STRA|nr:unnamed protein product [Albugo candida]|eukprot:CCI11219.1 unnamed protein product [Albugo candida]